jgi:hypothetical protein
MRFGPTEAENKISLSTSIYYSYAKDQINLQTAVFLEEL